MSKCGRGVGMERLVIAIDGPAAAGKSTISRELARRLGGLYLDTGSTYRAITWKALHAGIPTDDEEALAHLAAASVVELLPAGEDGKTRVMVDGQEVTRQIRSPLVDRHVSRVAAFPRVREQLVDLQRRLAGSGTVVIEGRDAGTVVVPTADYKFFLTATLAERTRRRQLDLMSDGHRLSWGEIQEDLARRDLLDSQRTASPLAVAPGAVVIDTTKMTADQVVERILREIRGCKTCCTS